MADNERHTEAESMFDTAGVEYHPPPNTSEEQEATTVEPRLLTRRVDALTIVFKVQLDSGVARLLEERAQAAVDSSAAELELASSSFELKVSRGNSFLSFQNDDIRGTYDFKATGGFRLELIARATYLATHDLQRVIDALYDVAAEFGEVIDTPRLRRFDCAADYSDFPLSSVDAERLLTKRAKIAEFQAEEKDVDEVHSKVSKPATVAHRSCTRTVTGFGISAGNPISARIYDKTAELLGPGRERKREIEHALWEREGWDGKKPVTRVEFQHTGKYLDEIKLRDPGQLIEALDAIWQRDTQWLRIVDPKSATRLCRCTLDPRWEAVVRTQFSHMAAPVERSRVRGGATLPHMVGTVLSRLSAARLVDRIPAALRHTGEVVNERDFADSMTVADAELWVESFCEYLFSKASADAVESYGQKLGWKEAAYHLLTKYNAAVARFTSSDDRGK